MRTSMVAIVLVGCSGAGSPPAGPPEILQVFARERAGGELVSHLAFGDHADIPATDDDRDVTDAVAREGQRLRVVVDELLLGSRLEEVACADGSWSRVPDDATFDDVAACAGADLSDCHGICEGIGILDRDGDGAFDDTRLIDGVVTLTCGGELVPIDAEKSYYQPSGSQRLSTLGPDSLGPAIAIVPTAGMRPGSTCGLAFSPDVVDKDGNALCAGPDCTPGDTSAISFQVEPMLVATSEPADGATDVDAGDAPVRIHLDATIDPATLAHAVTLTAAGERVDDVTAAIAADDDATLEVAVPGGTAPATTYNVVVRGGVDGVGDLWGDRLPGDVSITWTTKE